MIDDLKTKARFGYLGTSLSPGSNKRIIYLCSICAKEGSTLRCRYKEGHICLECARSKGKIGQAAIKEDILRVVKVLGHQPTAEEYEEVGKYSLVTVMTNFGQGWREILSSIGLKVQRRPHDSYSFEDVTKELMAVKVKLGFVPSVKQYLEIGKISLNAIKHTTNCNTWVDIIEKVLGISREEANFYRLGNYQTTKQYLEKLRDLAYKLGHTPSREQASNNGINSQQLAKRLNTNWLGVIKAAQLDPKNLPDRSRALFATKEDMIKDLRIVAKLIGKSPSSNQYKLHGKYAVNTVKGRLGSWNECLKAAGLDLESRYQDKKDNIFIPTDYYLRLLRELAQKLGRAPSSIEASKNGITIYRLYKRLKTNWAGILTIAGINYLSLPSISLMHYVTNEEALEDVARVASLIGHKPSVTEYKKHGIYSPAAIIKRFGKWLNVLDKIEWDGSMFLAKSDKLNPQSMNLPVAKDIILKDSLEQDSATNVRVFFSKGEPVEKSQ